MHLHTPSRRARASVALVLLSALSLGCSSDGENGGDRAQVVEPHVFKGRVTTEAGLPVEGVNVYAENTMDRGSHVSGATDKDGAFRIALDPSTVTTYRPIAIVEKTWDGQDWSFWLNPSDNAGTFASRDGAIRNFTWDLQMGALYVIRDYDENDLELEHVELDFAPAGNLIDGSAGEPFTVKLTEGTEVEGLPIGRFNVTARDVRDASRAIRIRPTFSDAAYADRIEVGFESKTSAGEMRLQLSGR